MSEETPPQHPPGVALQQVLSMAANLPVLIEKILPVINQNEEELMRAKELEKWFKSVVQVSGFSGRFDIHSESSRTQFEGHIASLQGKEKQLQDAKKEVQELQQEVQKHSEKLCRLQQRCKRLSQEVMKIVNCEDDDQPSTSQAARVQDEVISSSKHSTPSPINAQSIKGAKETTNTNDNIAPNESIPDSRSPSVPGAEAGHRSETSVSMALTSKDVRAKSSSRTESSREGLGKTASLPVTTERYSGSCATSQDVPTSMPTTLRGIQVVLQSNPTAISDITATLPSITSSRNTPEDAQTVQKPIGNVPAVAETTPELSGNTATVFETGSTIPGNADGGAQTTSNLTGRSQLSVSISPAMALNATSTVSSTVNVNPSTSNSSSQMTQLNTIPNRSSFVATASTIYRNVESNPSSNFNFRPIQSNSSFIATDSTIYKNVKREPSSTVFPSTSNSEPETPAEEKSARSPSPTSLQPMSSPRRPPPGAAFSSRTKIVRFFSSNPYATLRRSLTCNEGRCKGVKFATYERLMSHIKNYHHCVARKSCGNLHPPKRNLCARFKNPRVERPPAPFRQLQTPHTYQCEPGPSSRLRIVRMPSKMSSQTPKSRNKSGKRKRKISKSKLEQVIRSVSERAQESGDDEEQAPTLPRDDNVSRPKRKRVTFDLPDNHEDLDSTEEVNVTRISDEDRRAKAYRIMKWCKVCDELFPDDELDEHTKTHKKPSPNKEPSSSKRGKGRK